jgi:tRNA(Leu) C34 or U34 (ribose-2'-O)-methylase TrmL
MKSPAVVLVNPKYPHNVAAAIRGCSCFGLTSVVWTGERVTAAEYARLPREERMKGYSEVEWRRDDRPFDILHGTPVCVEIAPGSSALGDVYHPDDAVYVFGPEDGGLTSMWKRHCHYFFHIPSRHCLNLAAAVNVVLFDRIRSHGVKFSVVDIERRGEVSMPGWDGK